YATFTIDKDIDKPDPSSKQGTAKCLELAAVNHLNETFQHRPLLKYWKFQNGEPSQNPYPYLHMSILWAEGSYWALQLKVDDPKRGPPLLKPLEEKLQNSEGLGCAAWKPLVLKELDHLIEHQEREVQTILQVVAVTAAMAPINNDLARVLLQADSDYDLLQRRFLVDLIDSNKKIPGRMFPCGTGRQSTRSAEVRLSRLSSTPTDAVPGFIAKRFVPFAVYLKTDECPPPGVSVAPPVVK